ncbi:putative PHD finger and SET domain protein [Aspergillus candidus]|uniref:SET domain-containing protein n=1 Tax=Aspergillus candidus TaxID=41067 RepID=A0A2I2F0T5_ASPCN|nr:hypothetical protein BDW47DRAFT_120591 [Aspergillus candidus]PLB34206.1 hypothetical protein BDW47DRAFT_120591 [Aspergillus candidus]
MTDTSPVAITHPTTEPRPVTAPLNSPALNGAVSDSAAPEEEPYTIKCICAFEDDDGNTHIDCYYPDQRVPEVHNCVDCEPRLVDSRRATERQRRRREQSDGGDRKTKRSGTKSHKKKPKDHGDQANGFHHRSESGTRDPPPAKKSKTNHRPSGSVSSMSGLPSLAPDGRKRGGSSMSPIKPSGPLIPLYSSDFLHLYDRDQGYSHMDSNLFVNLPLAADLASWVTKPEALANVTNGRSAQDIFTWSDAALDRGRWPELSIDSITDPGLEVDGRQPTWKILKTRDPVGKDQIVGEITGKIGLLRDYCLDPGNRWQELRHPEPFVFFHPQLPIYIDSRHEGSTLRFVRRSCRPNVTMKTYITNEEDIPPGSEITAMWYLDPQLFESTNGLVKQETSESAQDAAAICISNVLAHFGGCACVPPPNCLLSSVDRRRHPKALDSKSAGTKRKKPKIKSSNISPAASNSRAGSEMTKNADDDDQADSRSTSDSVRGQTHSRDLTPTLPTHDGSGFGESELSAREKRKIAAAEKKFQQLEQNQQASHKRRKRVSGPSLQTSATQPGMRDRQSYSPSSGPSPGLFARHGSPRRASGPSTPSGRHGGSPQQYVDSAIQTEVDNNAGLPPTTPTSALSTPRRSSFVPLTQRLLKRCYSDRVRLEQVCQRSPVSPSAPLASPSSLSPHHVPPTVTTPSARGDKDVDMKDLGSSAGTSSIRSVGQEADSSPLSARSSTKPPAPPPWPSTAAHNSRIPGKNMSNFGANLRVSLPPPAAPSVHSASSPGSATASTGMSPPSTLDSSHPNPTTPGPGITAPSPVKKKLSLGDYLIRRGTLSTPTSEKTQAQATSTLPQQSPPSQPSSRRSASRNHDLD